MFILGIDGGGTHTRAELRDSENRFLRRAEFGPFNPAAIGEEVFCSRLREIFTFTGSPAKLAAICIGGAGSSGGTMERLLRRELDAAGFRGALTLCGDHEIALAGAMEGAGCILIAGTGSICYGRNASGQTARCGGWGHLLDDGGSAYAIGQEALSMALRVLDGRAAPNPLCDAIMAHLNAKTAGDLIQYAYFSGGKTQIAALAPLVLQCAEAGESVSLGILETQAEELKALAAAVSRQLSLEKPPISLLGGLLERENVYSHMVQNRLSPIASVTLPAHDPLWGAAQTAYRSIAHPSGERNNENHCRKAGTV